MRKRGIKLDETTRGELLKQKIQIERGKYTHRVREREKKSVGERERERERDKERERQREGYGVNHSKITHFKAQNQHTRHMVSPRSKIQDARSSHRYRWIDGRNRSAPLPAAFPLPQTITTDLQDGTGDNN